MRRSLFVWLIVSKALVMSLLENVPHTTNLPWRPLSFDELPIGIRPENMRTANTKKATKITMRAIWKLLFIHENYTIMVGSGGNGFHYAETPLFKHIRALLLADHRKARWPHAGEALAPV